MSFRILEIGLGNRGKQWADVISSAPGVTLAAAVDPSAAARAVFTGLHPDVPVHDDLEPALRSGSYDAALLVTPPDGHLQQVTRLFESGLPVLCEKPLAAELADATAIVALATRARLPLSVGLNFRFLPVTRKLRELLAERILGEPGFGQFTYQRNRDGKRPGLNKYPLAMRHPMLLEQSIHHLDLIRFCYGREVERVLCRSWNPAWSMYAHDANVSCLLTLTGGLEVNYLGTWTGGWDALRFEWRTDCANGVIVQRELFADLAIAQTQDTELRAVAIEPARAFFDDSAMLLREFVAALSDRREPPCSGPDHLRSLALVFACIESAETGRSVDMAAFERRHGVLP